MDEFLTKGINATSLILLFLSKVFSMSSGYIFIPDRLIIFFFFPDKISYSFYQGNLSLQS